MEYLAMTDFSLTRHNSENKDLKTTLLIDATIRDPFYYYKCNAANQQPPSWGRYYDIYNSMNVSSYSKYRIPNTDRLSDIYLQEAFVSDVFKEYDADYKYTDKCYREVSINRHQVAMLGLIYNVWRLNKTYLDIEINKAIGEKSMLDCMIRNETQYPINNGVLNKEYNKFILKTVALSFEQYRGDADYIKFNKYLIRRINIHMKEAGNKLHIIFNYNRKAVSATIIERKLTPKPLSCVTSVRVIAH
jgi:hypothetical protein